MSQLCVGMVLERLVLDDDERRLPLCERNECVEVEQCVAVKTPKKAGNKEFGLARKMIELEFEVGQLKTGEK